MNLADFSRFLTEELRARLLSAGDPGREVGGVALEDSADGWLAADEVAVTTREFPDDELLKLARASGSPALVWRAPDGRGVPKEAVKLAGDLGLGLFALPPEVPLKKLWAPFSGSEGLLARSHSAARALLEASGEGSSVRHLTQRLHELFGRPVAVEDPVGRLLAGGPEEFVALLEERGLRASSGSRVDETRRERRDRYARLPDGYLSVPVERWRVTDEELFFTPIGSGAPAGYLWMDLRGGSLSPEDVVFLYWARRVLEAELGKERVRLETELGARGDFVDDLVSGHYGSVTLLLQRARYLGADLSAGALVMIVDIDDFARYLERRRLKEPAIQELKKRLADAVRLQARQVFGNFMIGPRSDNVILLIGASEDLEADDIPEKAGALAAQIQRYVRGLLPDLTVSVGIGRYAEDPASLPEAYSEAEVALEIGHRIHGPSSVSTFEGTGTYKLLFRVLQDDPAELETFYAESLGPVVAYDSRYGTELVHTLTTYLRNDASTVKTASDLFAHRHTIRYRLDRVGELTGLNVDRSEDRERLTLGIKVMQLLGRVPARPSTLADRGSASGPA